MKKFQNAKSLPRVYYGLHFSPGVAEYKEPGKDAYRILINENAAKAMDPTFAGKPVYVGHVEDVDLENLQMEADGYVTKSFYNEFDGKHWVEFIVVSDKGHQAIGQKWRLSNAYVPQNFGSGGLWHGVSYIKEVLGGEYEHLAIVNDPRYDESVILTPEEFKKYNEAKEIELQKLKNSNEEKGESKMKFSLFKKEKVENSKSEDLEKLSVVLPKSKVEMTISDLVEEMDTIKNMHGYANGDHLVKVGEDEMSVNDLVKKHMETCNKMTEMENASKESEAEVESMDNEDVEADEKAKDLGEEKDSKLFPKNKKKNEKDEESTEEKKKNFDKLKNAQEKALAEAPVIELAMDRVARGKQRYGSN